MWRRMKAALDSLLRRLSSARWTTATAIVLRRAVFGMLKGMEDRHQLSLEGEQWSDVLKASSSTCLPTAWVERAAIVKHKSLVQIPD